MMSKKRGCRIPTNSRDERLSVSSSDSERDVLLSSGDEIVVMAAHGYSKWHIRFFLGMLCFFSAIGGFLFGYDTGVVSGAMMEVKEEFKLTEFYHELVVAAAIGAAAVAAAIAGVLTDMLGRKPVLMLASLVFTTGAAVMGAALNKEMLLVGRIVIGLGIGLAAMAVPMYIAESAPVHLRGVLVVVNNLFITGGQFIATVVDGAFSPLDIGWRFMLGLAGLPSIVMFVGFFFMPESPRWLVFHGQEDKARKVLMKLRRPGKVEKELRAIVHDYEMHTKSKMGMWELVVRFFSSRTVLLALVTGCGLQVFQQLGGINTIMYYSASIIAMAGFDDSHAIWLATVPAFGNFVFTIAGLLLVERIGRRKLLIGSIVGFVVGFGLLSGAFVLSDKTSLPTTPLKKNSCDYSTCVTCVADSKCGFCTFYDPNTDSYTNGTCSSGNHTQSAFSYSLSNSSDVTCQLFSDGNQTQEFLDTNSTVKNASGIWQRKWYYESCPDNRFGWLAIIAMFIYIAFFAPGMGPLPWTINAEIYPTWARSTGISIATATNWLCNLLVSLTFLTLADALGQPITFGLYAGLGLIGLVFVLFMVPETKGKSLEEVEELFKQPYFMSCCKESHHFCSLTDLSNSKPNIQS